jgi:sigma-B regulation protein RsbU (phosphoserine phosphatase)
VSGGLSTVATPLLAGRWVDSHTGLVGGLQSGLGDVELSVAPLGSELAEQAAGRVVVVGAGQFNLDSSAGRDSFAALAAHYLLVVVVSQAEQLHSVEFFRLGAVDLLPLNAGADEVATLVARLQKAVALRAEAAAYSEQLELANSQLQESLQLLKQDQLAGLEVQKSLMPDSPLQFGHYQISHSVRPSLYLSGDFVGYNFVLDRYLLFYFADVSGHGASSAFVTVLLRFMIGRVIRRHTYEHDYEALARAPEGLVEHINTQLLATGLGKHLTLFAGSLDLHSNTLRYVVGAQLPAPVLISGGQANYLPGKGRPAGIFEEASWAIEEVTLSQDSALLLVSDGVLDFIDGDNIVAKEAQLLAALQGGVSCLDELQDRLGVSFVDELQDDVSMLLLQRQQAPQ